jgi:hypothetical protein
MVEGNHTVSSPAQGRRADDDIAAASPTQCIDRLVTGDLNDAQRFELLAWLDEEPTRWRRCGLAFLEAQVLREALAAGQEGGTASGATASDTTTSDTTTSGTTASDKTRPSRGARSSSARQRKQWGMLAFAAALGAAFVLGWVVGQRPAGFSEDREMLVGGGSAQQPAAAGPAASAMTTAQATGGTSARPAALPIAGGGVALVRVRVGDGPAAREMILPVLAGPGGDASWDRSPGPLPDYVRQQWERQGFRVTERRQTVPLKLADGRQVDVPLEHVMLTFVGQPTL